MILRLLAAVEEKGLNAEGIYRKAGSQAECRDLIDAINNG